MATPVQIAANRANSTRSTGPVTEAGKQTASRNAVTHGMTSSKIIVPGEDPAEFEALRADTVARLAPQGEMELALAEEVAIAHWRHRRMLRYEAAFWHLETTRVMQQDPEQGSGYDTDLVAANLFTDPAGQRKVSLILRYVTAAERAYKKAVEAFEAARATRPEEEGETEEITAPPPAAKAATPASAQPKHHSATSEIGFVSQTAAEPPDRLPKAA